jgi:translation initiation factor 1
MKPVPGDDKSFRNQPLASLKHKFGALPPGPEQPAAKPERQGKCIVRRQRSGHGGKSVTIIEGPALIGRDLETLASNLKRSLGTGARVEDGTIVVQGDQPDRVCDWLTKQGFSELVRGN